MICKLIKSGIILCVGIIAGGILIIGVFCLPTDKMRENMNRSLIVFEKEDTYPELVYGYKSSRLDNFTDAIMLTNVINETEENPLMNAFKVNRVSYDDLTPGESLIEYTKGTSGYHLYSYARYWHGYLVLLKPLFLLFDYQDVRMIITFMQALVAMLAVVIFCDKGMKAYILPVVATLGYLYPPATGLSIQFSSVYFIAMLSSILLLKFNERLTEYDYLMFLIIGMMTGYFDLLTYPLLTLGMPLVLYFIVNPYDRFRIMLLKWMELCMFWTIGYLGIWGGKWIVATLFTHDNVIMDAIERVIMRASRDVSYTELGDAVSASVPEIIMRNLNVMLTRKPFYFFLLILAGFILLRNIISEKKEVEERSVLSDIPIILTGMLPFAWYMCTGNHSYVHFCFTYRTLSISVFAGMCIVVNVIGRNHWGK